MVVARRILAGLALLATTTTLCWAQRPAPKGDKDAEAKAKGVEAEVRENDRIIAQGKDRPRITQPTEPAPKISAEQIKKLQKGAPGSGPPVANKQYTPALIGKMYSDFLTQRKLDPQLSEKGNMHFSHLGLQYYLYVHEGRPELFHLVYQDLGPFKTEAQRAEAVGASVYATGKTKCAKVFLVEQGAWVSVEMFVLHPEDFAAVFDKAVAACDTARVHFTERMNKRE